MAAQGTSPTMPECFRECDVRGIYPSQFNEDLSYQIGRTLALLRGMTAPVLLGCDQRRGSLSLKQAIAKGLVSAGADVCDLGLLPTPVLYFARRYLKAPVAVMVTASHNPPQYNGLKILTQDGPIDMALLGSHLDRTAASRHAGRISYANLGPQYCAEVSQRWSGRFSGVGRVRDFLLFLDPGNGAWSEIAPQVFHGLGIQVEAIHNVPDGSFPGRPPDCAAPGNLSQLCSEVRRTGAAAGFAWDGDGDRLAVCDDRGTVLSSDRIALLLLPHILPQRKRERILVDVKMSNKVKAAIESLGAIPVVQRSAHCALERTMIAEDCLFGCEYSGHYFFRELGGADDGMHAAIEMTWLLWRTKERLSEMIMKLPHLFITSDIRIPGDRHSYLEWESRLMSEFPGGAIDRLDGLKINLDGAINMDGAWVLLRRSVSENKVSCRIEANSAQELHDLVSRVRRIVPFPGAGHVL